MKLGLDIVRRKEEMEWVKPGSYSQRVWWSDEETRTSQVKNTVAST